MEQAPFISVITASYNYASMINRAIDSVLAQTYKDFELIIVDDGSSDNSLEVIEGYVIRHDNVHLYCHTGNLNRGLPATLQLGIEKAKGKYIAFCESDDTWRCDHLAQKVKIIKKYGDVRIISNGIELVDGGGNTTEHFIGKQNYIDTIDRMLTAGANVIDLHVNKYFNMCPTFSAIMIEADILKTLDFNTPIKAWIDFWLYRQILSRHKLYYTPEKLTFWNIHQGSYNSIAPKAGKFIKKSDSLITKRESRLYRTSSPQSIIASSPLFDAEWYKSEYGEDIGKEDPAAHYLELGWILGYNPSPEFSTKSYLSLYEDIRKSEINPLLHYEMAGRSEGRIITAAPDISDITVDDIEHIKHLKKKGRIALLISHELSLTGAPRALLNMAIALKKHCDITPVIVSDSNGPLAAEIEECGIRLHIVNLLYVHLASPRNNTTKEFVSLFDIAVFNTAITAPYVASDAFVDPIKIIWLHEGTFTYKGNLDKYFDLHKTFSLFDHIYAVGNYSRKVAEEAIGRHCGILFYGIQPIKELPTVPKKDQKIRMLIAGIISKRKGQHILIKALSRLSAEVRNRIHVYIAGAPETQKYVNIIRNCHYDCVEYLGGMDHDSLMELYQGIDVLVCPSLDDPMPIVCTEAMALKKAVIVSESTGTASLIDNGVNGFLVKTGDDRNLAEVIEKISGMSHKELAEIGQRAYSIYAQNFTMEHFFHEVKSKIAGVGKTCDKLSAHIRKYYREIESDSMYIIIKERVVKGRLNFLSAIKVIYRFWKTAKALKYFMLFPKLIWYRTAGRKKRRKQK